MDTSATLNDVLSALTREQRNLAREIVSKAKTTRTARELVASELMNYFDISLSEARLIAQNYN